MKHLFTLMLCCYAQILSSQLVVYDPSPDLPGNNCPSAYLDGPTTFASYYRIISSVADKQGNLISTGYYLGFDDKLYLFIQKNKADGSLIWREVMEKGSDWIKYTGSVGTGLAVDSLGNIYLSGFAAAQKCTLLGQTIQISNPLNYEYPQAFLTKIDSTGKAIWIRTIQSPEVFYYCQPSSILLNEHDGMLYLGLHAESWEIQMPDGTIQTSPNHLSNGWLLRFSPEGILNLSEPIGDLEYGDLKGAFNFWPDLNFFAGDSYDLSPQLKEGPDGLIYVRGVSTKSPIVFGAHEAQSGNVLGADYHKHHFVAIFNPEMSQWEKAFISHSIYAIEDNPLHQNAAFEVDAAGDCWVGFGLTKPDSFHTATNDIQCQIGQNPVFQNPTLGFLAKFSANGQLNALVSGKDAYVQSLSINKAGEIYMLGSFNKNAVFQWPSGETTGVQGTGDTDLFLAEISPEGNCLGMRAITGEYPQQSVSLVAHNTQMYLIYTTNDDWEDVSYFIKAYSKTEDCTLVSTQNPGLDFSNFQPSPNPTQGQLFWRNQRDVEISQSTVFDGQGTLKRIEQSSTTPDLSQLPTGLYHIQVKWEDGCSVVRKVLKI